MSFFCEEIFLFPKELVSNENEEWWSPQSQALIDDYNPTIKRLARESHSPTQLNEPRVEASDNGPK